MYRPLADEMRPATLEDVAGQGHILGRDGILRRIIESGKIPTMVFYGPSGIGKTTVANIIASNASKTLYRLNATTASIADIKDIIADLDTMMAPQGALLYLDEIQYFNKKQQQSLLEFIESGKITLIASTTENPYFYVYNAILSRATVFEFKPLTAAEVLPAINRAIAYMAEKNALEVICPDEVKAHIASACGGDVRKALNAVELLFSASNADGGILTISMEDAAAVSQRSGMRYDRDGDSHYDVLSAFQKSIRGSDPDAGVHYLARLIEAGDLASICRRLLVIASEDIGLAYPQAGLIVKSLVDSALQLGLPEARIPLSSAVLLLALAPKSNSAICAVDAALSDIKKGKSGEIPAYLMDAHYEGAEKLGRGLTYRYPHSYPNSYISQQYLPDNLKHAAYYEAGDNKTEQAFKKYWDCVKSE